MRTPLTAIISYADLIQWPETTPAQCHQFADIIRHESERLNEMATNFLDLARLESGRASLDQDPVDLSTVILMAVSVLRPQADVGQIGVSVDVPANLPSVRGDAQRLHEAMLNLLSNAIKYCRPGDNIAITASDEEDHLTVTIADTGPGIPEEVLPYVFERFYRVPGTEDRVLGTGLGLTITRKIIEAHGGEISVTSEEGRGATFTFVLPVDSACA